MRNTTGLDGTKGLWLISLTFFAEMWCLTSYKTVWVSQLFTFKRGGGKRIHHCYKERSKSTVSKDGEICQEQETQKTLTLPAQASLFSSPIYRHPPKSKQCKGDGGGVGVGAHSEATGTACTVCWVQGADFWLLSQTGKILLACRYQKAGYLAVKRACVPIREMKVKQRGHRAQNDGASLFNCYNFFGNYGEGEK